MTDFDTDITHQQLRELLAATALAQQKAAQKLIEADFDGELQADAALAPEIAQRKLNDHKVAGKANVRELVGLHDSGVRLALPLGDMVRDTKE